MKIARHGGLSHLERLLRVPNAHAPLSADVVFISVDLEVSREERAIASNDKHYAPRVREFGTASLDTRHIFPPGLPQSALIDMTTRLISTSQLSTSSASEDYEDCDVK